MTNSIVQAVIFDKTKWNTEQARQFLQRHEMKPIKRVHITKNYYRYRLVEPNSDRPHKLKEITDGVKLVLEF